MASSGAYQTTARLLNDVWTTRQSLKSLVYDPRTGALVCSKATYALCTKVLACQGALTRILARTPDLTAAVRNRGLLYATVYELVAGPKQKIQGGGAVKRHILKHEQVLREAWSQEGPSSEVIAAASDKDDVPADGESDITFPRYIRVNTLRTTTENVEQYLTNELQLSQCRRDEHIPDLLVLPAEATPVVLEALSSSSSSSSTQATSQSTSSTSLRRYDLVLQDKSSCFSAFCLVHGFDNVEDDQTTGPSARTTNTKRAYLDACAAPGNKTTHLAALVHARANNRRATSSTSSSSRKKSEPIQIHAFDRSTTRFQSLQDRVANHMPLATSDSAVATTTTTPVQVHTHCADFLTASSDDPDYAAVTDILLDPSCSGSGIFTRQQRHKHSNRSGTPQHHDGGSNRLASLAQFQTTALVHAMTKFDHLQRIVYSTCSLHEQENEHVVAAVLSVCGHGWKVVAPACLTSWSRRGHETAGLSAAQAAALIRVDRPDCTNGFFVACFQRTGDESRPCVPTGPIVGRLQDKDIQEEKPGADDDTSSTKKGSPKKGVLNKTQEHQNHHPLSNKGAQGNSSSKAKKEKKTDAVQGKKRAPAWVKQSGSKKKKRK